MWQSPTCNVCKCKLSLWLTFLVVTPPFISVVDSLMLMESMLIMKRLIILLLAHHLPVLEAKIGFVKDLSMDAQFPGPVYRQAASLPEGHMRPLGWQRRPDGPITEEPEMPATKEFFENYVSSDKPGVFRNAVSNAPAFTTWQDDKYLTEKYGDLKMAVRVKVARRRDKIESTVQIMKFKKFLYDYMYDELYLASVIPRAMMDELPLPKCIRCGTISERYHSAQLWMSSGGTSSRIHSHDNHLLHCVLFGRRDFILIEGKHKKSFDFDDEFVGSLGGHSDINTEMINAFTYKNIARVPWIWSTLYPGDCIYVPAGYIHQVRSHGRSISLTIEFIPFDRFDDNGCTLIEEEFIPLSEGSFLLSFEDGRLHLTETNWNEEDVRQLLILLMGKTDSLTVYKFENFYKDILGEVEEVPDPIRVFEFLTLEDETEITRKDILSLPHEALQKIADIFNSAYKDIDRYADKEKSENNEDNIKRYRHEEF
ncbi:unnamed protein product [Lymnaea stagnalis]|uniref:JmjC domain-containing protein n=1 Tax=Lymnaea stagnalis TaxID=6523 RepID=A0AAV2IIX8_LYMST